jgi:membrane protein
LLIFLAGSTGMRTYLTFILDKNAAYVRLAAPIAALLFFFVLALGVLLGAEFYAAIQERAPAKVRPPRVLDPRSWQRFQPADDAADAAPSANGSPERSQQAEDSADAEDAQDRPVELERHQGGSHRDGEHVESDG